VWCDRVRVPIVGAGSLGAISGRAKSNRRVALIRSMAACWRKSGGAVKGSSRSHKFQSDPHLFNNLALMVKVLKSFFCNKTATKPQPVRVSPSTYGFSKDCEVLCRSGYCSLVLDRTERRCRVVSTPASSYPGGPGLKSEPGDRTSWRRIFVGFSLTLDNYWNSNLKYPTAVSFHILWNSSFTTHFIVTI
jgi:hypothetical protein